MCLCGGRGDEEGREGKSQSAVNQEEGMTLVI